MKEDGLSKPKYQKMSSDGNASIGGLVPGMVSSIDTIDNTRLMQGLRCPQCNIVFPDQQSYSNHMTLHAEASLSLSLLANDVMEMPRVKQEYDGTDMRDMREFRDVKECNKCGASFR